MRAARAKQPPPSEATKAKIAATLRRPNPSNAGPLNGNWVGDAAKYHAAHTRARRRLYGRTCIDCGDPKIEAALVTGRGTLEWQGHWYSPNPDDYEPRCHRCHHRYDHEGAERDDKGRFIAKAVH